MRALAEAGLTPLADGRPNDAEEPDAAAFTAPTSGLLGGFVPGRQPLLRPELVVLVAPADGPLAAAVLEAGRLLVIRSMTENEPGRTVLVALTSGAEGPSAAVRLPVWPADAIREVLVVGEGPELPDSLGGAVVRPVSVGPTLAATATRAVRAALNAAVRPVAIDSIAPAPTLP